MLKEDYITVGNVSVKDMSKNPGMIIYPNPSRGDVKVRLLGGWEAGKQGSLVSVEVVNSSGMIIKNLSYDPANGDMTINMEDQPDGLYIVRISSDNHSVQRKLSLFK